MQLQQVKYEIFKRIFSFQNAINLKLQMFLLLIKVFTDIKQTLNNNHFGKTKLHICY